MYPSPIGIIAGGGNLPREVILACKAEGREIFVVALEGFCELAANMDLPGEQCNIAAVGKIMRKFKERHITDVVLVGKVQRPKLSSLRPDAAGVKLMAQLSRAKSGGDITLFNTIITFLKKGGFTVKGIGDVASHLLVPKKVLGKKVPGKMDKKDIEIGVKAAQCIGKADIGQAVIVQQRVVLGVEAIEGTDALIKRCAMLKLEDKGGVLVKVKKPSQDVRIDLPTVGVDTIKHLHKAGFNGVAVEAGAAIMVDKEKMIETADHLGIFIVGV